MNETRQFYEAHVNAKWPKPLPKLTAAEAERAARRLYRFVFGKACPYPTQITSGRNHSYIRNRTLRVNPDKGWSELVHGLSHSFYGKLHPDAKPHSGQHGSLERHMVQYVLDNGFLDGKLKAAEKVAPDPKAKRYAQVIDGIERWEAKLKRAENALKKLRTKQKYYEKTLAVS